jgi:hypothetical protein
MLALVGGALLALVFVICDWSGRTLAHHYQDRLETAAIFAIGACVIVGLVLARGMGESSTGWPEAALALSTGSGLFAGYMRGGTR